MIIVDEFGAAAVVDDIVRHRTPESAWPPEIREHYQRSVLQRLLFEGPFHLTLGLLICIATLAVDALVTPHALREGMVLRVLAVAPLTLLGLIAIARQWVVTAALCIGGTGIAFAWVILHLSSYQSPEISSRYIIAIALLPGLSNMVLPFTRRQLRWFNYAFGAVAAGTIAYAQPEGLMGNLDVMAILGITQFSTYHLAGQSDLLRQNNFLLGLRNRFTAEELLDANRELRRLSDHDPLTGLPNRRHFERVFEERFIQSNRQDEGGIALMMIDLDHFKHFNDQHGHQAGDHCLKLVGHAIDGAMRSDECTFARYGGEEFILAMREGKPGDAEQLAERICESVAMLPGRVGDEPLITTSVGVATAPLGSSLTMEDLIEMADAALYAAKHAGRNRYEIVQAGRGSARLCA